MAQTLWILVLAGCFLALYACAMTVKTRQRVEDVCHELHSRIDNIERTERLTPSKVAELAEFKDAMARAEALLKSVNQREVMRARRAGSAPVTEINSKDELRRRAGLIGRRDA